MATVESPRPPLWTHRAYFKQYSLNVEQYGEILVAQTFAGKKMGDAQPCFDVEASVSTIHDRLVSAGVSAASIESCLSGLPNQTARIEVKSKLARTAAGKANVVHCSENKLVGARTFLPATHFAVLLVDAVGFIEEAWLLPATLAKALRRMDTKSRYIPVPALRKAASTAVAGLIDIQKIVNETASSALVAAVENHADQQSVAREGLASLARA